MYKFMNDLKVIFFDVGNTLIKVDNKNNLTSKLQNVVRDKTPFFQENVNKYFRTVNKPYYFTLKYFLKEYSMTITPEIYNYVFTEAIIPDLYKDVKPIFEFLKKSAIAIGIISNCSEFESHGLDSLGLNFYIKYRIYSFEVGYAKPDLEIFNIAKKLTGYEGNNLLYVGDHYEMDFLGALSAGWNALYLNRQGLFSPQNKSIDTLERIKEFFLC